jgi:hypothetical protein
MQRLSPLPSASSRGIRPTRMTLPEDGTLEIWLPLLTKMIRQIR